MLSLKKHFQLIVLDHDSNRLVKHITEAFRLGRFSCVPSVACLVDVRLQVLIAHVVVATVNHSSEMAPEPLNTVGEIRCEREKIVKFKECFHRY